MGSRSAVPASRRAPRDWLVYLALAGAVAGLVGSTAYSARLSARVDRDAASIASDASPAIEHLTTARGELFRLQLDATRAVDAYAPGAPIDRSAFATLGRLDDQLRIYATFPFYPYERELYDRTQQRAQMLRASLGQFAELLQAGDVRGAREFARGPLAAAALQVDAGIGELVAFNADQQHRMGLEIPAIRARATRITYALGGGTTALALVLVALVFRAQRRHARLLAAETDRAEGFAVRLRSMLDASMRIAHSIAVADDPRAVLQQLVDESRALLKADFAAFGVDAGAGRPFDPWVHAGIPRDIVEALGSPPRPVGLLGVVADSDRACRLARLDQHPAFRGLPPRHPAIGPFLGVPILDEGRNVGNLFVARQVGAATFSDADEEIAKLFAAYAGIALTNAELLEQALGATRARDDLLATVTHDLKNPLSNIQLSATLLSRSPPEPTARELASRILRATERMNHLVRDLLDAAKIEADGLEPERHPENARDLVEVAAEAVRLLAADASVSLHTRVVDELVVLCERHLLLRVFSNLLGNAVKFTPPGGTVEISAQASGAEALFAVKDTGVGMPAEAVEHAFDRYWQAAHDRRGSGLGLFIVKGIVEAHGGRIWLESAPGAGTTVRFTLPTVPFVEASAPASK